MKTLISFNEIREYAEEIKMTECRVHYYDFVEQDGSEDPHGQLFTVDDLINFLWNDNTYERGFETLGHELIFFNDAGYVGTVLTA